MMRLDPALSDEGPNGEESVTTVDLEQGHAPGVQATGAPAGG